MLKSNTSDRIKFHLEKLQELLVIQQDAMEHAQHRVDYLERELSKVLQMQVVTQAEVVQLKEELGSQPTVKIDPSLPLQWRL